MAVARKKPDSLPDPLATLAAEIEKCHQGTVRALGEAIDDALRCGELLNAAKGMVKHGEWVSWVEANTTFGIRQAQKYIRRFTHKDEIEAGKCDPSSYLPINDALALIAESRPAPRPSIDPRRPFNGLTAKEWAEQGCPDSGLVPPEEDEYCEPFAVETACGRPTGIKAMRLPQALLDGSKKRMVTESGVVLESFNTESEPPGNSIEAARTHYAIKLSDLTDGEQAIELGEFKLLLGELLEEKKIRAS